MFNARLARSGDGTWIALWEDQGSGLEPDTFASRILASRSIDNGAAWGAATTLFTQAGFNDFSESTQVRTGAPGLFGLA